MSLDIKNLLIHSFKTQTITDAYMSTLFGQTQHFTFVKDSLTVGVIFFEPSPDKSLYISHLCVHETCRRQGIATHLLNKVAQYAAEKRIRCLKLAVEIGNESKNLYDKYGFIRKRKWIDNTELYVKPIQRMMTRSRS